MEADGIASYPHHRGAAAGMRLPTDSYKHLPMGPARGPPRPLNPTSSFLLLPFLALCFLSPHPTPAKEAESTPSSKPHNGPGTN